MVSGAKLAPLVEPFFPVAWREGFRGGGLIGFTGLGGSLGGELPKVAGGGGGGGRVGRVSLASLSPLNNPPESLKKPGRGLKTCSFSRTMFVCNSCWIIGSH